MAASYCANGSRGKLLSFCFILPIMRRTKWLLDIERIKHSLKRDLLSCPPYSLSDVRGVSTAITKNGQKLFLDQ